MNCFELPPHLHVKGRCVEDVTGRYLDGDSPAYVSKEAQEAAQKAAQ